MNQFLKKTTFFLLLTAISFFAILFSADGYTDPYYVRFTTPKQTSLILGTSRTAQGIQPEALNKSLGRNDFFNYSFTLASSRFGPNYLNIIKGKLDTTTRSGIFIITVDPWSISSLKEELDDTAKFVERRMFTSIKYVNMNPNLFYLGFKYPGPYFDIIKNRHSETFLHNDGWLEIDPPMDSASMKLRLDTKIRNYKKSNLVNYKYSSVRFEYLQKTINYLKEYGEVYLVRLPIHPLMMEIENQYMADFNAKTNKLSIETNCDYYDMSVFNSECIFVDGNHLYKPSCIYVSQKIGEWILAKSSFHSEH